MKLEEYEDIKSGSSREYFCRFCGQLRLALYHTPTRCKGCNSVDIIIGMPMSLNKANLKQEFLDKLDKSLNEDLEREFFDCKITSCYAYDTCETQDDRDKNKCDMKPKEG